MNRKNYLGLYLLISGTILICTILFVSALVSINDDVYHVSIIKSYVFNLMPIHNIIAFGMLISGLTILIKEYLEENKNKKL